VSRGTSPKSCIFQIPRAPTWLCRVAVVPVTDAMIYPNYDPALSESILNDRLFLSRCPFMVLRAFPSWRPMPRWSIACSMPSASVAEALFSAFRGGGFWDQPVPLLRLP